MKLNALDHVNIITNDLDGTCRFFMELFGLDVRDGPAPFPPEQVQWLYDDQDRAVFHINSKEMTQAFRRDTKPGPTTGAIHHVALDCSDHLAFITKHPLLINGLQLQILPVIYTYKVFPCGLNAM